ncbi:TPR-like protein [Alternaria alternata]|uniref:TPR-like protein n=3 Tax=Alternaria alternata complex TaxID=187734 RepID=A0A177DSL3_ALTAL|nr:TPR-like protein [Alternaria alternata]OAG22220.1 TPR-like protein [Alternaria alternata]
MPQPLPSKEQTLFRSLVKFYEGKLYKKGLKAAEQILKKHPTHGDTQAMKALILNSQGQGDEAFALCKEALRNDMKSHICWHVYGLLWRSVKNYPEAIKSYKMALRLEPGSLNILRDLALLQCQVRDYEGYIESRRKMMQERPQLRQNWTALAVAYHLSGNYAEAENILKTYEETLKQPPSKLDLEHSEATLYKNQIIYESGDVERALKHLDEVVRVSLDRCAALELKAKYLLELGQKEEAEKAYRILLGRNSEYRAYFDGLEKSLGLDRSNDADIEKLNELYQSFASKNERNDAARRIPLDFLQGEAFKTQVDQYLRRMLNKGVPSTFPNIKSLYQDEEKKAVIEELVLGYASEKQTNGETNGDNSDRFEQSVLYFLAQHYNYVQSRDLNKAMEYIDKLLEKDPKSVDYNQTKARIYKHMGDVQKASETINHARELDERDRYINTKCAKYQLRNNENETALNTMSKFTRNETVGGPLGDLHDMQCMWYLLEDGEAYLRQEKYGLALKRFTAIADIFDIWHEDQFDFHSFSLRKGQIRAYIDMVRWEDHLRDHPFFTRAATQAVELYIRLADNPKFANTDELDLEKLDPTERKKAEKKAKKEREKAEKAEAERKAAAAAKATAKGDDGETKKEDQDPNGEKLLQTKQPLEDALRFLQPMLELAPKNIEAQNVGFEVYLRRNKFLLALKCLQAAREIDPENPKLHEQSVRFRQALAKPAEPLSSQASEVIKDSFTTPPADADLKAYNDDFLKKHSQSASHLQSGYNVRYILDNSSKSQNEQDLQKTLDLSSITIEEAQSGLALLNQWGSEQKVKDDYRAKAAGRWSDATACDCKHPSCGNCDKKGDTCSFLMLAPSSRLSTTSTSPASTQQLTTSPFPTPKTPETRNPPAYSPTNLIAFSNEVALATQTPRHTEVFFDDSPLDFSTSLTTSPSQQGYFPELTIPPYLRLDDAWKDVRELLPPPLQEVLCHYEFTTSLTLAGDDPAKAAWQTYVPEMAQNHDFLTNCVLSVASLHLGRLYDRKEDKKRMETLAAARMNKALVRYRTELENVTQENAAALFASSTFTAVYLFRTSAIDIENLRASISPDTVVPPPEIVDKMLSCALRTIWGLRGPLTVLLSGWNWVVGSKMQPVTAREWWPKTSAPATPRALTEDQRLEAIEKLWMESEASSEPHCVYLSQALLYLRQSFNLISQLTLPERYPPMTAVPYSIDDTNISTLTDRGAIFVWAARIPREFIGLIEAKNAHALVILAHYAVLPGRVRNVWWLEGLGADIVTAVAMALGRENWALIEWPAGVVGVDLNCAFGLGKRRDELEGTPSEMHMDVI